MMSFDAATWGTVGQWVSATGTTAAFSATFYVIRRDGRYRRLDQAKKVALIEESAEARQGEDGGKNNTVYVLTLVNLSDQPIYDAQLYMSYRGRLIDILSSEDVVLPGASLSMRRRYPATQQGSIQAIFRDNAGNVWRRTLRGRIVRDTRTRRLIYGPLKRTLPFVGKWQLERFSLPRKP